MPFGTDPTSLTPTIAITGASVSPASGAAQDFTAPVIYTVTAADLTTKAYTVTVSVAPSSAKDITQFTILGVNGAITGTAISLTVPFGTDPTSLTPAVAITGASVSPTSGAAQDFTAPVTYTVAAADLTTKTYTATVTVAAPSCAPGTYLVAGTPDTCATCTSACADGTYESSACATTHDRACTTCTAIADCNAATCTNDHDQVCTPPPGAFYVSAVFVQATNAIIGIATSGTDVYFLDQTSPTSFAIDKVDATGTLTTLVTTTTATWRDIAVSGDYLFILQSITSGTTTHHVLRYRLSDFSFSSLTLPVAPKRFASDGGSVMFVSGATSLKGIMYFQRDAFTALSVAKTAAVYNGLTYRTYVSGSGSYGYLYGTRGSGGAGQIDEIPVSSLSSTSVSPYTVIACPAEIITPNLIKWVPWTSSFVITDQSSDGTLGATTNGQIYSYEPSYSAATGALFEIGAGTLVIRGNSNSGVGSTETAYTTMIPGNKVSTDSSEYLYQALALDYNINASGFVNLFAGNGGASSGTGYLVKFYDALTGSPIGGQ